MGVNHTPIGTEYGRLSPCKLFDMKIRLCRNVHPNLYESH
jgi:hypothetical protein